jgi:hypothetical protein
MLSGKMPVFPYAIILIFREGQIANLNEIMGGKHPASSILASSIKFLASSIPYPKRPLKRDLPSQGPWFACKPYYT